MIIDGKKAGDIVQEGNKLYKVLDVMVGGYILEDITNKPQAKLQSRTKKAKQKEEPAETVETEETVEAEETEETES